MKESTVTNNLPNWQLVGLITLSIRFVQGWIFWAGGSRRFIYAPQKLDPYSHTWLATKLQSAMPGALLGVGHIINYLLSHFWVLYISLVSFSLIELVSGLGLLFGFFTRLSALLTAFISVILILSFGWEGGTCLDEWTVAVSNFAMALVLMLSGSPLYSLDHWLLKKHPSLYQREAFLVLASGPLPFAKIKFISILFLVMAILFTTSTYDYFRGAIFSRFHPGPVSPTTFELSLSNGQVNKEGDIIFNLYMSGGTTSVPDHIMRAELQVINGPIVKEWTSKELSALTSSAIVNAYRYLQIKTGPYGLVAPVGAKATITLKTSLKQSQLNGVQKFYLHLYTINGMKWSLPIISN